MKIASISVAAQHPKGLDLHIKNLKWAIGEHQIYIFTFRQWFFDKSQYPEVIFIEVEGDPLNFYQFWNLEIPSFLEASVEDVFVITELDTWFHKKVEGVTRRCFDQQSIQIDSLAYPEAVSGILRKGKEVYPRIWENAAFIPGQVIRKALKDGIGLNGTIKNGSYIIKNLGSDAKSLYVEMCNGRKLNLNKLCLNYSTKIDTLFEFTLYCFSKKIKFEKLDLTVHLPKPETVHRLLPASYGRIGSYQCLLQFFERRNELHHLASTLFMYYVSGVLELTFELKREFSGNKSLNDKLLKISSFCSEWMNEQEHLRFNRVLRLTSGALRIL